MACVRVVEGTRSSNPALYTYLEDNCPPRRFLFLNAKIPIFSTWDDVSALPRAYLEVVGSFTSLGFKKEVYDSALVLKSFDPPSALSSWVNSVISTSPPDIIWTFFGDLNPSK